MRRLIRQDCTSGAQRSAPLIGLALALLAVCTAACAGAPQPGTPEAAGPLQLTTPAFAPGEAIPQQYTCDGQDTSPALLWSGVPPGAQSLALIMDDPDAPGGTWVHWVLYNLPPDIAGLEAGVEKSEQVSGLGLQGVTDFRRPGYGGPCPPAGSEHRYFLRLYALDTRLELPGGATREQVDQAMQGHILAQGELMGVYAR